MHCQICGIYFKKKQFLHALSHRFSWLRHVCAKKFKTSRNTTKTALNLVIPLSVTSWNLENQVSGYPLKEALKKKKKKNVETVSMLIPIYPDSQIAGDVCSLNRYLLLPLLRTHIEIVHTKRASMIPCTRCTVKKFDTWGEMVEHRRSCVLVCEYPDCPWTTTDKGRVAAHKRGHLVMMRRME